MTAFLFAILSLLPSPQAYASFGYSGRPFLVVLDPGHGGIDKGATYRENGEEISEKDLTLAIAKKTATELKVRGISVRLTRGRDVDLPLAERTGLANRLGADVFLSIHLNSTETGGYGADGVETFILNNESDASSRRLAQIENRGLRASSLNPGQPTDVALILKDLRLDANLPDSKRLACSVQNSLGSRLSHTKNRGVKQALFYVLLGADMPSALVEAGFLSNARDRSVLTSPAGQRMISQAIASSIARFKDSGKRPTLLSSCKIH